MKIVITFYRVRKADGAHAVVGRETVETADIDNAVTIARQLSRTLDMPQRPDAMVIHDEDGSELCSGPLDAVDNPDDPMKGYHHERQGN